MPVGPVTRGYTELHTCSHQGFGICSAAALFQVKSDVRGARTASKCPFGLGHFALDVFSTDPVDKI